MKTLSKCILAAALLAIVSSSNFVVFAHSFPEEETPSAGQKLTSAPSEVKIKFDAPIEKIFAKLEVVGADGKNLAVGDPAISDDGLHMSVKVNALNAGDYTVRWSVVGIDTHHTEGSYTFTVATGG